MVSFDKDGIFVDVSVSSFFFLFSLCLCSSSGDPEKWCRASLLDKWD